MAMLPHGMSQHTHNTSLTLFSSFYIKMLYGYAMFGITMIKARRNYIYNQFSNNSIKIENNTWVMTCGNKNTNELVYYKMLALCNQLFYVNFLSID